MIRLCYSPDADASASTAAVAEGDGDGAAGAASTAAIHVDKLTHVYPAPRKRRGRGGRGQAPAEPAPGAGGGGDSSGGGGQRPALDAVSLDVRPGEVFGILGPNGSGKSTLFRILSTVLRPTSGRVTVFGHDVRDEPAMVRGQLGVVFQMPSLDGKLTARENLVHQGHLYGLHGADLSARIDAMLALFALADRQHEYVERFSGGMRRRVELAKAMLHAPPLLLLDEPATGLDPGARIDLWRQLESLRSQRGVTVALTTHLMEEADRCDRLAVMAAGRIVAVDTPANLKRMIGGDVITVEPDPPQAQAADALASDIAGAFGPWDQGAGPIVVDGRVRFEKDDGAAFIATLSGKFTGRFRSVTVGRPTLEDVFMRLTGHALWSDE